MDIPHKDTFLYTKEAKTQNISPKRLQRKIEVNDVGEKASQILLKVQLIARPT